MTTCPECQRTLRSTTLNTLECPYCGWTPIPNEPFPLTPLAVDYGRPEKTTELPVPRLTDATEDDETSDRESNIFSNWFVPTPEHR